MRFEDWPVRLDAEIEAARPRVFQWGEHDCLMFTARVVQALTGVDHAAAWRGKYETELGAARILKRLRYADTAAAATDKLGPAIAVLLAQRGDVVTFDGALGICSGAHGVFVTPEGLTFVPLPQCVAAWRVD